MTLQHPDRNVRSRTALSLDDVSALMQALVSEPDLLVREDITFALVRMGAAAVQPLIALLVDANPTARHLAAHTLGKIADARALEPLMRALHDTEPVVVSKAALALEQIGDARAVPALVSIVGHGNREVQTMLVRVLETFGEASVQPLIDRLSDERWQVREQAADILGVIGDQAAVSALIQALHDEQWEVRFAVVTALGHIGGARAREVLRNLPVDPDMRVQGLVEWVKR